MARLTPRYSTNRVVREYVEQHYLPAAAAFRGRAAENGALGMQIVDWQRTLNRQWDGVRFGDVRVETSEEWHTIAVEVCLNDLDPGAVRVELYADGIDGAGPFQQEMTRVGSWAGVPGGYVYSTAVPQVRPHTDYTARVVPHRVAAVRTRREMVLGEKMPLL